MTQIERRRTGGKDVKDEQGSKEEGGRRRNQRVLLGCGEVRVLFFSLTSCYECIRRVGSVGSRNMTSPTQRVEVKVMAKTAEEADNGIDRKGKKASLFRKLQRNF